jgi:large subunit ribosomal protein L17
MLANLVSSLIKHKRITTTLAKAKAARSVAEKMVTLGKGGTLHDRRLAAARLRHQTRSQHATREARAKWRQTEDVVRILFEEIAPVFRDRRGGYTRIIKMHQRQGDAADLAILEWVESVATPTEPEKAATPATEETSGPAEGKPKKAKKKAASTKEEAAPTA